jgi:ATP-binding cassette subfamily C protein LapB
MNPPPSASAPYTECSPSEALLACVSWICQQARRPVSEAVLSAGLPMADGFSPQCALKALRRLDFEAGLLAHSLDSLPEVLLPIILLLKDQGGAILLSRVSLAGEARGYRVIFPASSLTPVEVSHEQLCVLYGGYVIAAQRPLEASHPVEADSSARTSRWLTGTLWRLRGLYASAAWGALLINVLALASIFFTMNVYDRVVPNQAYVTLWSLVVGVLLAMILESSARLARAHLLDTAGRKADLLLGSSLFEQALAIRMEHRPASSGAFANQLREFESVRDFATSATLTAVSDLPFALLFITVIFLVGGPLGWVPLTAVGLILAISLVVQWPLAKVLRESLQLAALKQGVLIESIEGLETLKSVAGEGVMQHRWQAASAQAAHSALRVRKISTWATTAVSFIQQVQTVAIITWGVYLIDDATLSLGALIASVMLCSRATAPLVQVASLAVRFQQARAALQSLNALMALPTDREAPSHCLHELQLTGQLTLREVGFAYPAAPLQPRPVTLSNINLTIQPGERVAIVGAVGSGKSTLLRLFARLYQPTGGQILSDGLDVSQIDLADWRRYTGFVAQDARLFQGTLKDNLTMGCPTASTAELLRVLRLTGLDKMAARHPLGVQLPVGEAGVALSGGQRQLVALARTLLAQPGLLLLDEPTSAMDSQTESAFLQRLHASVEQRTLILVTHRPAVLALVQRIIVIEDGKVVADGAKARILAWLADREKTGALR